ncbi:hypothetical protein ACIBAC_26730 [Streptomyces sp. NPDC051362]|uniref:hypothetical protein n=1 Tax=Streptomyces sp. NPDC051362 TaxID=3365651 RepID=UPI0037A03071
MPPRPAPVPPPRPTPKPEPTASARPTPAPAPVSYPAYRPAPHKHQPRSGPSLVSFTLLITAPAVLAVAALRPR